MNEQWKICWLAPVHKYWNEAAAELWCEERFVIRVYNKHNRSQYIDVDLGDVLKQLTIWLNGLADDVEPIEFPGTRIPLDAG